MVLLRSWASSNSANSPAAVPFDRISMMSWSTKKVWLSITMALVIFACGIAVGLESTTIKVGWNKPGKLVADDDVSTLMNRQENCHGGNCNMTEPQPNMKIGTKEQSTNEENHAFALNKVPKVGLLILTRGNIFFESIYRDWEEANRDRLYIKIHCKDEEWKTSDWLNRHRTQEVKPTKWGELTPALMQLTKEALEEDPDVHRFVFICGATIPLQTFDHVYKALYANDAAWVEPMKVDRHMSHHLKHKHQLWRVFNRTVAEAFVYHGHYERYSKMIEEKRMPWNLITDEFYFSQVAHDEGLFRPSWVRSVMWTFWYHDNGYRPSSPSVFGRIDNGSREELSLKKAKYVGVLFARKFSKDSDVVRFRFHLEPLDRDPIPVYPQLPGHHVNCMADDITEGRIDMPNKVLGRSTVTDEAKKVAHDNAEVLKSGNAESKEVKQTESQSEVPDLKEKRPNELVSNISDATADQPMKDLSTPAPVTPVPKIGLLFLTTGNLNFEDIYKKWEEDNPERLYIKAHVKDDRQFTSEWLNRHRTNVTLETEWGNPKLVKALIQLVKEALEEEPHAYRFVFMCGATIPLQTFDHVYKALYANDAGWVEPMRIDWHMADRLHHKHQLWRAFNRSTAEAYVNHGHFARYEKMVEKNEVPWNLLTDEFYFSQVAHDEGLYKPNWIRTSTWTWWHNDNGHSPSSPSWFGEIRTGSREEASLKKAKSVGILFARKFGANSDVRRYNFHLEELDRDPIPIYPQGTLHIVSADAQYFTEGPLPMLINDLMDPQLRGKK